MCKIPHRLGQRIHQLLIDQARHADRPKSAVGHSDAVQLPALAFLDKIIAVGGLGGH